MRSLDQKSFLGSSHLFPVPRISFNQNIPCEGYQRYIKSCWLSLLVYVQKTTKIQQDMVEAEVTLYGRHYRIHPERQEARQYKHVHMIRRVAACYPD